MSSHLVENTGPILLEPLQRLSPLSPKTYFALLSADRLLDSTITRRISSGDMLAMSPVASFSCQALSANSTEMSPRRYIAPAVELPRPADFTASATCRIASNACGIAPDSEKNG
jgi:hypothetical protein